MKNSQTYGREGIANPIGYYITLLIIPLTLITFTIAFLALPISGSSCLENCIEYPYLDILSRFPRDYFWMYPAMLLCLLYMGMMVSIHQAAKEEKKFFSLMGSACAVLAAGVLLLDYFMQVSVIQPSLLMGETESIAILTQYNPHGLFIALEEAGYILMSISFLCMAFVFSTANRAEKALRWILLVSFFLTVISLVGVSLAYGLMRGYRFEIIVISIDWLTLIAAGIPLARLFKQQAQIG
jgi:hypothetical protein